MDTLSKIIELISKKGIKENIFLSDLGFNKSALSDWKKGTTQSYIKHIAKIATYFNVSTDYLLGNEHTENDITFDDFTFAFYEETKELTDADKENLLDMARIFNKKRKEREKKDGE